MIVMILWLVGACASAQPEALDGDTRAELSARAAARAYGSSCLSGAIFVRDELFYSDTLEGDEEAMPELTRAALVDLFDEIEFVDRDAADELTGGGEGMARGVLVSLSPADVLAEGVVGVDVGVVRPLDGYRAETMLFMWDGSSWIDATSEDTGVTVTSAVS